MSYADAPPPYPGTEKGQPYPPMQQQPYPPMQQQPYPPMQQQQGQMPGQPYASAPPPPGGNPAQAPPNYPAYPSGYYPAGVPNQGMQQGGRTVIVASPTTVTTVVQQFRGCPVNTGCPRCQAQVLTNTTYETGTFTWVLCAVIFLVGCVMGCCLIPFCVDGCKDVVHSCPNCKQQISRWNRM